MKNDAELMACNPDPVNKSWFNPDVALPYGCTVEHIRKAMCYFVEFIGFVDQQLHHKGLQRIETMMMPANFSSMVGEFMHSQIPKYCAGLVRNKFHNGHPDLLPAGKYEDDNIQYAEEGVEIKASRYLQGWQGHNPENTWLMVFVYDGNRPRDEYEGIGPKPFRFIAVYGARLTKDDWSFAGRSETSRRTITASVLKSGCDKMKSNWIYEVPEISSGK